MVSAERATERRQGHDDGAGQTCLWLMALTACRASNPPDRKIAAGVGDDLSGVVEMTLAEPLGEWTPWIGRAMAKAAGHCG